MDGSTANLLRRFLQRAPDALTDEELLTLLLHAGTGAEEPRTLAARLIGQFGSLGATLSASPEELASVEGMDASRALLLRLVTELHRRYYLSRPFSGARLTGTTDFGNFLLPFFYGAREELVYLLALDAAYPLALFRWQHMCDVKDPEPSDFYLGMQRAGWCIYPILLLIGYNIALRVLP